MQFSSQIYHPVVKETFFLSFLNWLTWPEFPSAIFNFIKFLLWDFFGHINRNFKWHWEMYKNMKRNCLDSMSFGLCDITGEWGGLAKEKVTWTNCGENSMFSLLLLLLFYLPLSSNFWNFLFLWWQELNLGIN